MNERGREALRAAAVAGVRQITGKMRDSYGGRCGLAVLHDVAGCDDIINLYGLGGMAACPVCGKDHHEYALVAHGNDAHHLDFFKLAEFMPITDVEGAGR